MKRSRTMPLCRKWLQDSDLFARYGKQLPERQRFAVKVVLLVVKDFQRENANKRCEVMPETEYEAAELSLYVRAMNRLSIFGERGF